jgi:pimeloyl-ACP methyl ester carboxylesterase
MSESLPAGPPRLAASLTGPRGAPVLVLGNSIGTTRAVWDPQAAALGARFRLLRFEYPGHGGSAARPGPYSIGDLAGGVLALLDAHGVDRASYCGISLGGMVGIWLAAHAPERVAALALCCTSAYLDLGWAERAALVRAKGMGPVADQAAGRWFTAAFRQRDPAAVAAIVGAMRVRRLLRRDRRDGPAGLAALGHRAHAGDQRRGGSRHPALARRGHRSRDRRLPADRDQGRVAPGQRVAAGRDDRRPARAPAREPPVAGRRPCPAVAGQRPARR